MFGLKKSFHQQPLSHLPPSLTNSMSSSSINQSIFPQSTSSNQNPIYSPSVNPSNLMDSKFIFYNSNQKFTQKIEFYSIIHSSPSKRVLTIVDCNTQMEHLPIKIAESFELFPEYKGLDGLRAINLTKRTANDTEITLPLTGTVNEHLTTGDYVYCTLDSNEYWVRSIITIGNLINSNDDITISLELKINGKTKYTTLKHYIFKCGLNMYMKQLQLSQKNNLNFIVYDVDYKFTNSDNNNNYDNDNIHIEQFTPVKEFIGFKSKMQCKITVVSIEEQLFLLFKNIQLENIHMNKIRFSEFEDLTFYLFQKSLKFKSEFNYIRDLTMKIIKQIKKKNQEMMYIYKYQNIDESNNKINKHNMSTSTTTTNNDDIKIQKKIIFILDNDTENYINDDTKYINNVKYSRSRRTSEHTKKSIYKRNNLLKYNDDILTRTYSNEQNSNVYNKAGSKRSSIITNDNIINNPPLTLFPEDNAMSDTNSNGIVVQQIKRRNVKAPTTTIRERIGAFRATSLYANLIKEFSKAININQYVNNINCQFMPKINDGTLERINLPEMRNLKHLSNNGFRTSSGMFGDDLNDMLGEGQNGDVVLFGKIRCGEFMVVNVQVVGFILGFLGILIYCLNVLFSM